MVSQYPTSSKLYYSFKFCFYLASAAVLVGIFAYAVHLSFSWFPYIGVTLLVSVPLAWGITSFEYSVDKEAYEALRLDAENEQLAKEIRAQKAQTARSVSRFPLVGRRREDFPIIGPSWFCDLINRMLDQMESNAPEHYREAIEYLEKAEYHLFGNGYVARCDGLFNFSEDFSYHYMLWVWLHEVGHRVHGLNSNNWSEDAANSYAETVIRKVER